MPARPLVCQDGHTEGQTPAPSILNDKRLLKEPLMNRIFEEDNSLLFFPFSFFFLPLALIKIYPWLCIQELYLEGPGDHIEYQE